MEEQTDAATKAQATLDNITQEAWSKTGGDIYGTEPPVEQPVDSPPVTETTQESVPAASPSETPATETTSEPVPLIFGKYKTTEEAERGYFEAVRMGNEAKSKLDTVQKTVVDGPTPVEEDPLDSIENYGVPKDLIARAIDSRVQKGIGEYFRPAIQISQADKQIIEKYPDYQEKFSEIEAHAQGDPEVWQQINELNQGGNYLAARRVAYLNWKVAQANAAVEHKTAAESARKEEVKDARRDAGVGATRRSDSRTAADKPPVSAEDEKRLIDLYKSGHTTPYLRHKLDGLLPPNFDEISAQVMS